MKSPIFLGRMPPSPGSWPQCIGLSGEDRVRRAIDGVYFQGLYARRNTVTVIPKNNEVYQLPDDGES